VNHTKLGYYFFGIGTFCSYDDLRVVGLLYFVCISI